jgi:hypothetical protein
MYQDRFDDGEWAYACRFTLEGDSDADHAQHIRAMRGPPPARTPRASGSPS